jgi:hypothetical protein
VKGYSAAPVDCDGQADMGLTKHVPDVVSQQFVLPLAAAGQLFWQSVFALHVVAQVPLPPLEPLDEVPPPLLGVELLPEEEPLPDPPSSPLVAS